MDTTDQFIKRKVVNKIHEKYKGEDFNYKESTKDEALNAWERFKIWLAKIFQKLFNFDTPKESIQFVQVLLKIFGVLIIVFVLFKIVSAFVNDNGNSIFGRKSNATIINATDIETDIHSLDFTALIEDALINNDYRLTIRYYYLLILKKLTNKQIIDWDTKKTNYDYYQEIENEKIKKQFKYISYIYDYCWYGEFNIEQTEFSTSEKAFKKLITLIEK